MIQLIAKHLGISVISTFVIVAGAWAQDLTKKQDPIRIGISDQQGTSIGLSFMPPDDASWNITRDGLEVSLRKKGMSEDENSQIEAFLITLDTPAIPITSFIERIRKNTTEGYEKNSRFKIITLDVTEDSNIHQCARVHVLLEDLKPVRTVAHEHKKFSEQHTLACGLLKNRNVGFEIRYYHRFYEPNKDDQLESKANDIFTTVVFEDK